MIVADNFWSIVYRVFYEQVLLAFFHSLGKQSPVVLKWKKRIFLSYAQIFYRAHEPY